LLLATVPLHPAAGSAGCAWQVFKPPNPDPGFASLVGVTVVAPNDVWAFGVSSASVPLQLQHFDGTSWRLVPAPALPTSAGLSDMRAVSSNDIWAVGYQSGGGRGSLPLIVHWDGSSWSVVPNPAGNLNGQLFGVAPVGKAFVWVAGFVNSHGVSRPLIEHFDGHRVVVDRSYDPENQSILQAITGTSFSDIWAGGYQGFGSAALIERRDQTAHRWIQSPTRIGSYIDSMSARSPSEVWAVGPPGSGAPFVERWDGTAWKLVPYPRGGSSVLEHIDATASTGYTWVVGIVLSSATAFVDRYGGRWTDMRVLQVGRYATRLVSLAPVPQSSDVWVVGDLDDSPHIIHNLAERYTCT
jgi:hypothetical protein